MSSSKPTFEITARHDTAIEVRVEVPAQSVGDAVEAVYERYARRAHVPGFRKGHVPRAYLESRYSADEFAAEARADLHEAMITAAVRELKLRPVAPVSLHPGSWETGTSYAFAITVPVLPDITPPAVDGITLEVPAVPPITDATVEDALQQIQWQFATLKEKPADAAVAHGDVVRVRRGSQEAQIRVEEGDTLGERFLGRCVGDTIHTSETGSPDANAEALDILAITEAQLPPIDDDLAHDAGHDSLEALRGHVELRLAQSRDRRIQELRRAALVDELLKRTAIPLPDALTEELVREEIARLRDELADRSPPASLESVLGDEGDSLDALQARVRESVERRVRHDLLIDRLIEAADTNLDDAALEEVARTEAEASGSNALRAIAQLKGEGRWEAYRRATAANRALDGMLQEVNLVELAQDTDRSTVSRPAQEGGRTTATGEDAVADKEAS